MLRYDTLHYISIVFFCINDTFLSLCAVPQVLERHRAMDSMVELLQVYPEEDEAYGELLEATTQLYHYLLQPFRDMRELAMLRRQQIKVRHSQPAPPSVFCLDVSRFRPEEADSSLHHTV